AEGGDPRGAADALDARHGALGDPGLRDGLLDAPVEGREERLEDGREVLAADLLDDDEAGSDEADARPRRLRERDLLGLDLLHERVAVALREVAGEREHRRVAARLDLRAREGAEELPVVGEEVELAPRPDLREQPG